MKEKKVIKKEKTKRNEKRLEIAKEYQKNPFKIPDFMMADFVYSDNIKEAKNLIPSKRLIQKAFKNVVKQYMDYIKGKRRLYRDRYFIFNYIEVKNRSVLYWEFVYYRDYSDFNKENFTHERNQFVMTEAIDFKQKVGLINEKKNYSGMGGYNYKTTYDSFIYQYNLEKLKTPGSVWSGEKEYHKSFRELEINEYYKLNTEEQIKKMWYIDYSWFQKVLNQDPGMTEVLLKMGYTQLANRKLSRQKYDFLRKNKKSIPKNIKKEELDLMFSIYKSGNDPKDYKMIMDTFGLSYFGRSQIRHVNTFKSERYDREVLKKRGNGYYYESDNNKTSYSSVNAKVLYRVINLLNAGSTWEELNHFAGCCYFLGINQNEYIFKGRKEREAIVEEFERQKAEIIQTIREEKRRKENEIKAEKRRMVKSLEEVTSTFKELKIGHFTFIPLRTFKDFQETATKFRNCLVTNEFHIKVYKQQRIIYVAVPEGKKETDGEIVSWHINGKELSIDQIHGVQNRNTDYYEEIKEIASSLKYNDLVELKNLKGEGNENQISS